MWFKKKNENKPNAYFTKEWANEWHKAINNSEDYRRKGKSWNATLILKFHPVPEQFKSDRIIGFFLNLKYGECTELRFAKEKDEEICDVMLSADEPTWIRLIEEKKDPTGLIMKGSLKLEKGSLILLTTQKKAAKALLESAPVYKESKQKREFVEQVEKRKRNESVHKSFKSTKKGLDVECYPMQLFQKAKQFGIWNPSDIDFSKDKAQWKTLKDDEKEILIHLSALFLAGEEAVTLDLLPLIQVIANEGRIEEEIFLTSFLWEEAKHTEFFSIFVNEVIGYHPDFESFHGPFYKVLFYQKLPEDLSNLNTDFSPLAQIKASGTYNMIVEGTLAETGYAAYYKMLNENDLLPGLQEGIQKLKQDESRHIAFGIYLINRLLQDNPDLKIPFENHLEVLLDDATNIIHEIFEPYKVVPFGLEKEWFLNYAIKQFQHRTDKLGIF